MAPRWRISSSNGVDFANLSFSEAFFCVTRSPLITCCLQLCNTKPLHLERVGKKGPRIHCLQCASYQPRWEEDTERSMMVICRGQKAKRRPVASCFFFFFFEERSKSSADSKHHNTFTTLSLFGFYWLHPFFFFWSTFSRQDYSGFSAKVTRSLPGCPLNLKCATAEECILAFITWLSFYFFQCFFYCFRQHMCMLLQSMSVWLKTCTGSLHSRRTTLHNTERCL